MSLSSRGKGPRFWQMLVKLSRDDTTFFPKKRSSGECCLALAVVQIVSWVLTQALWMLCQPLQYHCSTIVNFVSSFHLGHVISSVTGHLGKTKVNLKETSKFVTG